MKRKGFTLSEVLISIATAGVIVVSLIGLFLLIGVSSNFGMNRARATQLAEAEMTRRKLGGYQPLVGLIGSATAPVKQTEGQTEFVQSTRVDRLSNVPGSSDYSLLVVTVEVKWTERRNLDIRANKAGAGEGEGQLALTSTLAPEAQY